MAKPHAPSNLIYDCGVDTELLLRSKLEHRTRDCARLQVIVRLKSGATHVGRVLYFDAARLTISQEGPKQQLCDLNYKDISRILSATKAVN